MTDKQRLLDAVKILADHNKWRRGEDDSSMPTGGTNPMLLGQAIDTVVELVPGLMNGTAITDEMVERAAESYHTLLQWGFRMTVNEKTTVRAKIRSALIAALVTP